MLDCKGAKEQSFDFRSYLGRGRWVHGTADCLFDNLTQMPIRHLGQSYNNGSFDNEINSNGLSYAGKSEVKAMLKGKSPACAKRPGQQPNNGNVPHNRTSFALYLQDSRQC